MLSRNDVTTHHQHQDTQQTFRELTAAQRSKQLEFVQHELAKRLYSSPCNHHVCQRLAASSTAQSHPCLERSILRGKGKGRVGAIGKGEGVYGSDVWEVSGKKNLRADTCNVSTSSGNKNSMYNCSNMEPLAWLPLTNGSPRGRIGRSFKRILCTCFGLRIA